jgi:sterol desaturase/sphingolipid hydroxylase (fatty acid hydroxylase superfamily)
MIDPFSFAAGWLHENLLLPLLYQFDLMAWEDIGFGWLLFAIYGVVQVAVTYAVCLPLERLRPLETWPDRRAVGVDIVYTLISRVGLFPLVTFVAFYQAQVWVNGTLADHGWVPPTLESLIPALAGRPILDFLVYLLVLDFVDYWRHRLSHSFRWWWRLHALHHAQEQLTFWSDDRNHLLDDLAQYLIFAAIALIIGIPPMQFPLLILLQRLLESLSHANTRLSFGWLGERLLISPRFHRAHHGVRAAGQRSCNYGAVLPYWDMLFGTADFSRLAVRTGVPGANPHLVNGTWWQQQKAAFVASTPIRMAHTQVRTRDLPS